MKRQRCGSGAGQTSSQSSLVTETEAAAATAAATGTSSTGSLRPAHHTVTRPCTRRGGVTASLQGSDSSAGESFVEDLTSIAGPKFGAWLANQGITMSALAAWNEDMMTNALAAMAAEGNAVPLLVIREAVEAARALVGPQCTGDGRDEHEQEDFANEDNGNFSATDEEEGSIELPSDDEELVYDHDINACGPGVEHQVNFTNEEHFVELEPNVEISENDLQQLKQEGNDFEYILQSQLAVGATTYRASSHHGQIQPRLRISFINAAIGFGLFLIDDIAVQPGTEIARYVGELLTQPKLDPRETQREQSSSNTKRRFVWDLAGDEACPVCKLTCDETVQNGQPILLCDVCDRSFHLACQGIADHTRWDRWACVDCVAYFVDRHTGRASSRSSSSATARSQNNENIIRRFNIKAIDATHKGNATRFINHSCNPNAIAEFDNTSREIKIIAAKVIASGRQITVDYSPDSNPDSLPPTAGTGVSNCLCRQPNCRGWVPV
jgi:predicted flap endonuclease-1-like 5' DNA nuclease